MQLLQTSYVFFANCYHVRSYCFAIYFLYKNIQLPTFNRKEYSMTELTKKTQYNLEYAKKNLKRIPLDVQKEKYEEIVKAALDAGESVNGYIKKAIDNRLYS